MAEFRFGTRFTLAGTTVVAAAGTATLIAAPGAGTTVHLGSLMVSAQAATNWSLLLQDSTGVELFTFRGPTLTSVPMTLPANGLILGGTARGLQLVNTTAVGGTIAAFGTYRLRA